MKECNFIKNCFYNKNYIFILFNQNMTLSGDYSILNSNNYLIIKDSLKIKLTKFYSNVYSYNSNYATFRINDSYFFENALLKCGYIDTNNVKFINSASGYTQDICTTIPIEKKDFYLSITKCNFYSYKNNSVSLINKNSIPYYELFKDDFFVITPLGKFVPNSIIKKSVDEYEFLFNEEIISTPEDEITLYSIASPLSTDVLGDRIKGNESNKVYNSIPTTIKNVSITSYLYNILKLRVDFNSPILRYDSSGFDVYINGVIAPSYGHSSYKSEGIFLTLYNINSFNYNYDELLVKSSNNTFIYTLDFRGFKVYDPVGKAADTFIALCGTIEKDISSSILKLNLEFNKTLFKNFTTLSKGILSSSKDKISLNIEGIGTLNLYGSDFYSYYNKEYIAECTINEDILNIAIDLIEDDFYSTNINKTNYISFSPNQNLQSVDGTYILISYEASVTFSPPPTLTIYPLDEGNEWSILGKTIANPVTLIVDRSKTLRNYGNLNEKTTFLNDLYIVHDDSKNIYDDVTITFTNIKASNIYVNLPDEYNLVIESSTIDYQKIY
nr:hypothetical protein [Clostridium paraputrificum]